MNMAVVCIRTGRTGYDINFRQGIVMKDKINIVLMILTGILVCSAHAAPIAPLDGTSVESTFEGTVTNTPPASGVIPAGWTRVSGPAGRTFLGGDCETNTALVAFAAWSDYQMQFVTNTAIVPNQGANQGYKLSALFGSYHSAEFNTFSVVLRIGTVDVGGTFTELAVSSGLSTTETVWTQSIGHGNGETLSLTYTTPATVSGDNLAVRIAVTAGSCMWPGFDNVVLETVASWYAINPLPEDLESYVEPAGVSLSWDAGVTPPSPITNHAVYFGTNRNAVAAADQTDPSFKDLLPAGTTTYSIGDLADGTTYYWRIDEVINNDHTDPNNVAKGDVWSFRTVPEGATAPVILAGPVDQRPTSFDVPMAVFQIEAYGADSYLWYKDGSVLSGSDRILGVTSNQLLIAHADASDEGLYHCEATNPLGTTTSSTAVLELGELLWGHWPLDGNVTDASGNGRDGLVVGTVGWTEGADGMANHAVRIFSAAYVRIQNAEAILDHADSFTISCWVKPDFALNFETYVSTGFYGGWYSSRYAQTSQAAFRVLWPDDTDRETVYGSINDGKWHMLTVVYDVGDNKTKLFLDGAIEKEDYAPAVLKPGIDMLLGALNWKTTRNSVDDVRNRFTGAIDDVRYYPYPLNPCEIAELYYAMTGQSVCVKKPAHDINGDCQVNIYDLALMVSAWLE